MNDHIKAAIIDLDGVITRTASRHARAWKKMFSLYNKRRKKEGREIFPPFSIEDDYPAYTDGIPRYDGVKIFLASRGIHLPYGSPDDEPGKETVCGLGNWKNQIFHGILEKEGVEVFEKNIEAIKNWRKNGMKTAVISSSKNCKKILEAAGLEYLFDTRIDGLVSEKRNIKGKPEPDIFYEAARELDVHPQQALIIEDALAGVEAGKKGNFGLVVGISTNTNQEALRAKGADIVVNSLDELNMNKKLPRPPDALPSAIDWLPELKEKLSGKRLLLLLDFDGTLTPIINDPGAVKLTDEMRNLLDRISEKCPVAVISGRDMGDVKKRVKLDPVYYSGSHGFEISGPEDFHKENKEAEKSLSSLDKLENSLKGRRKEIAGVRFERKKFALAVHYREVAEEQQEEVITIVKRELRAFPDLKKGEGKKVIEALPNLDWNKGKAAEILLKELSSGSDDLPVYIGDDLTDEDVFKNLENVTGILVGEHGIKTYADYRLKDVDETGIFLKKILSILENK